MSNSMFMINPLWTAENNFHNEGKEGYTANKKWILRPVAALVSAKIVPSVSGKCVLVSTRRLFTRRS